MSGSHSHKRESKAEHDDVSSIVPLGNIAVGFILLFMTYLTSRGFEVFAGRDLITLSLGLVTVLVGFSAPFHERIWAFNRWWFIAVVVGSYLARHELW